jgi:hypothetical protein
MSLPAVYLATTVGLLVLLVASALLSFRALLGMAVLRGLMAYSYM